MHMFGKPHHSTYEFAEKVLRTYRNKLLGLDASVDTESDLKKVYMIGGEICLHFKFDKR